MADSYNKKERDKKRRKRKQDKAEKKKQRQEDGTKQAEFMYLDADGNLTSEPQDLENREEVDIDVSTIQVSTPKMEDRVVNKFSKTGVVKFYDPEKRFGFILDPKTNQEYFVHINDLVDEIKEKDEVEFEEGLGKKGKVALKVKLVKK